MFLTKREASKKKSKNAVLSDLDDSDNEPATKPLRRLKKKSTVDLSDDEDKPSNKQSSKSSSKLNNNTTKSSKSTSRGKKKLNNRSDKYGKLFSGWIFLEFSRIVQMKLKNNINM